MRTDGEKQLFHTRLIWLAPAAYALHILEEAPRFADWVGATLGGQMTFGGFAVNNAVFMAVLLALCAYAAVSRRALAHFALFFWISAQLFWNFWFHWYTTAAFGVYSPGLVTATLLYYPLSLYLGYIGLRERIIGVWALLMAVLGGGLLFGLVVWAGLYKFGPVPWCKWLLCA